MVVPVRRSSVPQKAKFRPGTRLNDRDNKRTDAPLTVSSLPWCFLFSNQQTEPVYVQSRCRAGGDDIARWSLAVPGQGPGIGQQAGEESQNSWIGTLAPDGVSVPPRAAQSRASEWRSVAENQMPPTSSSGHKYEASFKINISLKNIPSSFEKRPPERILGKMYH